MSKQVRIVHVETGLVGKCLPESLRVWEAQGWLPEEESAVQAAETQPDDTTVMELVQGTDPEKDLEE